MSGLQEILELMPSLEKKDEDLIKKAYEFAKNAHRGQKRYSGEPYFNHVCETAKNLTELCMGPQTIAAGLLHDTLEDVEEVTKKVLLEEFGSEILFLVEGVTKLGHVRYKGAPRHIESLRKLFVATSEDLRVLIIKLADRLHNMQTLGHVPKEKQKRIALETMQVYAPIAHRLGMGKMTGELQDLAFPYVYPQEYKKAIALSSKRYKSSQEKLEKVYRKLRVEIEKSGIKPVETDYRRKHLFSLWKKLERKEMDIDRIYDILALRIIVPTVSDCYGVLGIVHSLWTPLPGRIKDYIAFPKPNGYKSIHTTILTGDGGIAEIQIRTKEMHLEAEYGIASHILYKNSKEIGRVTPLDWFKQFIPLIGQKKTVDDKEFSEKEMPDWIKEIAEAQKDTHAQEDLEDTMKSDFFENRIFVFTPKGDVIDLPADSSPIDFAYHIHSDIGDHVSAAKINSKLVSLDTKLHNGDIVDIETKASSKPSRKWLDYAKTSFARRKIKSSIQKS